MAKTDVKQKGGGFLLAETSAASVFTPEDFTAEHRLIAQTAEKFVERDVLPQMEAIERQDFGAVVRLLHKAGELGLLAHSVPEPYGGLGLDKITKSIVGEHVGRAGAYGVAHSNHTCIATLPITYFGTERQKEAYLPKLASGEYIGAYCLTEPDAGSDAMSGQTTARLNEAGTHYLLNGSKLYITNAAFSDTFIVYAKVDGEKFTAFLVEKGFTGLSIGPEEKKMGIKGSSTCPVILEDCEVPAENVIGTVGKGHHIAFNVLNLGRFNLGSACMGGAKGSLKLAIDYTLARRQFGRSIASFPATQEKLATMASRIYAAESLQYRTAGLLEAVLGDGTEGVGSVTERLAEYAIECAVCKVFGSETLDYVVDEAVQLHGGAGYMQEYAIERAYRDSRINRIFEGTNEINRLIIPGFLLRKAKQGGIPLQEAITQATVEWQNGSNTEKAREEDMTASMRRLFLALLGAAFLQFGAKLESEQELVMKLADVAISLYAAESAVLRAKKAEGEKLKAQLAAQYVDDAYMETERLAKQLVISLYSGEQQRHYLHLLQKECSRFTYENPILRKRAIAAALLDAQAYTC
ncbi:acyl-CoA dehydrogenase family protein [Ectobacillus ponti]|uniref:Acyl-CoA dehydrogenase family protein n=1 Tax=Ectobacillus ponti TaxID=2961894 RepID=A0AA41X9Z1_9BACI|nr:acyl-CoA dehydrogenase family protein [Ectobacillus ponti]MCP8969008.1 acyl-CoA dehydrogenase family protein [Ectobacillus ponti]